MSSSKQIARLSIIIPAHNEARTLAQVVERVLAVDLGSVEREIIVCDDGSSDDTPQVLNGLVDTHPALKAYRSPINLGKGAAVRVGIGMATGDVVLIQDADLELSPEEIPLLLAPFHDPHVAVVYGSRFASRQSARLPRNSRWANRFLTTLTNVLFQGHLTDMETCYKAVRRDVMQSLHLRCVRFDIEPEITAELLQAGHHIVEVPISYHPRSPEQGKKIAFVDGLDAVYTLLRCRFLRRRAWAHTLR